MKLSIFDKIKESSTFFSTFISISFDLLDPSFAVNLILPKPSLSALTLLSSIDKISKVI